MELIKVEVGCSSGLAWANGCGGLTVDQGLLAAVCARYGIGRLMIFGSVARGTAEPTSDLDILYELQPDRRLG